MWRIFTILLLLPFFFSCSIILTTKKNVKFSPVDENEEVNIVGISSSRLYEKRANNTFNVLNKENAYIVDVKRKGYTSNSRVVTKTRFNYIKIIDMLVPTVAGYFLFNSDSEDRAVKQITLPLSILGWSGVFWGPWKVYNSEYTLPQIEPLPKIDLKKNYIPNIKVDLAIPKENNNYYTFNNYDNYEKSSYNTKKKLEEFNETYLLPDENTHQLLRKFNLKDSIDYIKIRTSSDLLLAIKITSKDEKLIGKAKKMEVKTEVSLLNNFNNSSLATKNLTASSLWHRSYDFKSEFKENYQNDLINDLLAQFFKDQEVITLMNNYKPQTIQKIEGKEVVIKSTANYVSSIQDAVKAVVTVITSDGHGSGCIISNDGYIVTNSHVVSSIDTNITVQLYDSTIHKAKLLVANLDEDLALIKIDTSTAFKFNVDLPKQIGIGQEVYGIGAYNIDDYTVSISKGIVSSFRKVDGKEFIQTDVTINGGNSGGALINNKGELYGIITAKMVGRGIEGIGFVIPYSKIQESLKIKFE